MRCLVVGGGGFLGTHLCERLLHQGHVVRVLDQCEDAKANLAGLDRRIEVVIGDCGEPALVDELMQDADAVFHLAARSIPSTSNEDPVSDLASNLLPSVQVLSCARRHCVKKLVFFSSGGTVYGITKRVPINESHPTDPICSYGVHKLAFEKYVLLFHHLYGADCRILRVSNAYGPRQRPDSVQGAVAVFLSRTIRHKPLVIWGDGSVVRDYVYAGDVATAAEMLLHYDGEERVFNIGSGSGLSLLELIRSIAEVTGIEPELRFEGGRKLDVPINVLDITRARRVLGWGPRTGIKEGLAEMLDYFETARKGKV